MGWLGRTPDCPGRSSSVDATLPHTVPTQSRGIGGKDDPHVELRDVWELGDKVRPRARIRVQSVSRIRARVTTGIIWDCAQGFRGL